jgi:hypothetical protein
MIYFENLEKITLHRHDLEKGFDQVFDFLENYPNKNLRITFREQYYLEYDERFLKFPNRFEFPDRGGILNIDNLEINKCIDFFEKIDGLDFITLYLNRDTFRDLSNIKIDGSKFNYAIYSRSIRLSKKPNDYIRIVTVDGLFETNCKKISIIWGHCCGKKSFDNFDEVFLEGMTSHSDMIKCPPNTHLKMLYYEEPLHYKIAFPRGLKKFSIKDPRFKDSFIITKIEDLGSLEKYGYFINVV